MPYCKRLSALARIAAILCVIATSNIVAANRITTSINDRWQFKFENLSEETIDLPHTWNTDAYTIKNYRQGTGVYTKTIFVDKSLKGKQFYLCFEGVNKSASIKINGFTVGKHMGGYTPFNIDITDRLNYGSENSIKIIVDNASADIPPVSADFTFFGGIYRNVFLTITEAVHFDLLDTGGNAFFADITNVNDNKACYRLRWRLANDKSESAKISLRHILQAPDNSIVVSSDTIVTLSPDTITELHSSDFTIKYPLLWSPDFPNLYQLTTEIVDIRSGVVLDRLTENIGFKYFSFHPDNGFFLNGKPLKLNGVNRHQDMNPIGTALSDAQHIADMRLIKEMGANFVRLAHYPQSPAVLKACDHLGLLVWEEIPVIDYLPDSQSYLSTAEFNLREMIRSHYNHPSILMWGYMNEILLVTQRQYKGAKYDSIAQRTANFARHLESVIREEDIYRPSVMAFHGSNSYIEQGFGDITDIVGWNLYQGWYGADMSDFEKFVDSQHSSNPQHIITISEYGAGSDKRLHSHKPQPFDFSIEYQQLYLEHYLPQIMQRPYIAAHTYWNFIDFGSAKRDESMPRINNKGLVYANRTPKDIYYYFKAVNMPDRPLVHIACRDWSTQTIIAKSDRTLYTPVKVYTTCPEVCLTVNGKELAQQTVENFSATFQVPVIQGKNRIIATGINNNIIESADTFDIMIQTIPEVMANDPTKTIAINVGSNCHYIDTINNITYIPDHIYTHKSWGRVISDNTTIISTTTEISSTHNNPLFQTAIAGDIEYCFDAPNGVYELILSFADITAQKESLPYLLTNKEDGTTGVNSFDIVLNGDVAYNNYSCQQFKADELKFMLCPKNGKIKIRLLPRRGVPYLNAILIRKLTH